MIRTLRNNRPNILLISISRPNRAKTEYKNKHQYSLFTQTSQKMRTNNNILVHANIAKEAPYILDKKLFDKR